MQIWNVLEEFEMSRKKKRDVSRLMQNLHFESIMFQPDGIDFHSVFFEQFPDILLTKPDRIVSNVNFVRGPE